MTYFDVIAQILSEASEKPLDEARKVLVDAIEAVGTPGRFYEALSDDEARRLLHGLRSELPGIRRWLAEGRLMEFLQRLRN